VQRGAGATICDMAGRPKTRAKREAQAALTAEEIPVSVPAPADAMHARARANTPRMPGRPAVPAIGPVTRATADAGQAAALAEIGRYLRPGYTLRLERLQPQWCSGWVDDIPVDGVALGELFASIRAEYGGQNYRCIILGSQGTAVYEARISIASPPAQRGRLIDREQWEGAMAGRSSSAVPVSVPNVRRDERPAGGIDPMGIVTLLFESQRDANKATLDAVREMQAGNKDLIASVLSSRNAPAGANPKSLVEQLGELAEGASAIDKFGRVFGAARGERDDSANDDGLAKAAQQMFMGRVMESMFTPGGGGGQQQQPPGRIPSNGHPQVPVSIPRSRPIPVQRQK
jgi:hypothetical protein